MGYFLLYRTFQEFSDSQVVSCQ